MKMLHIYSLIILLFISTSVISQKPEIASPVEIYHKIEKLNFLGSVLYMAAHPDDENTRLISYMSNHVKANTAYLSLTRGDGGQNLIGTEISEKLGVLRTNELLQARSIDGGKQFFTRAIDFGYSKHPDETLNVWDKDKVLADVIWVIRNFKPDVIVNRFDHRTPGRTHGHHTSSAMLSLEAYDLTNDPKIYPSQLEHTEPWQVKRIFYNTSWWAFGGRDKFAKADKSHLMTLDVGTYYPWKGKSNNEVAAEARSMHKCQGFGSAGTRGSQTEYLELIKGDEVVNKENVFEGINTTWGRVDGGDRIGMKIESLLEQFDFVNPTNNIEQLIEIKKLIDQLADGHWKSIKSKEIDDIITDVLGLYVVAIADDQSATPGSDIELSLEFTNRSNESMTLKSIEIHPAIFDSTFNQTLNPNEANKWFTKVGIPKDIAYSSHYWLNSQANKGCYYIEDQLDIGLAVKERVFKTTFSFDILGTELIIDRPVVYSYTDRAEGEIFQPFEIIPDVSVRIENELFLFADNQAKEIALEVTSGKNDIITQVSLQAPAGWTISPESHEVEISVKGDSKSVSFSVTPPDEQAVDELTAVAKVKDRSFTHSLTLIDYDHIPLQTVLESAEAKIVRLDLNKQVNKIGYIDGAGDKVMNCLTQVGFQVEAIDIANISEEVLKSYDAVVVGIRALNVKEPLKYKIEALNNYVKDGGTLVYQYNTTRGLKVKDFAPYPLKLSRDRVTVEESPVQILATKHPVINTPNQITQADFEGWVQERGLYFPNEWDASYVPILGMSDPGYDQTNGSLLVAQHGDGYFVYSGISWFRELPAGVPGAFRLFANILAL